MVGQGPDSFAGKLHYPPGAKAGKTEAATLFFCEVQADGHARHIRAIAENQFGPFRAAVKTALEHGRFIPAHVAGKAVPVFLGGTVLFVEARGLPTILVELCAVDKQKAALGANYIEPQMLTSYMDLERKCFRLAQGTIKMAATNPAVDVIFNVDESGSVTSKKILHEPQQGGGWGELVMKASDGARFIPAHLNGKPVAGQFMLPIDFRMMSNPDEDLNGSHLRPSER